MSNFFNVQKQLNNRKINHWKMCNGLKEKIYINISTND